MKTNTITNILEPPGETSCQEEKINAGNLGCLPKMCTYLLMCTYGGPKYKVMIQLCESCGYATYKVMSSRT